jgi:hypothetical protein
MQLNTAIINLIENNTNTDVIISNFCGTIVFEGTDLAAIIAARVAFAAAIKAAFPSRKIMGHRKFGSKTWRTYGRIACGMRIELTEQEEADVIVNGSYHWSPTSV